MTFKLNIPYFEVKLTVVVDKEFEKQLPKYGNFVGEYETWEAGFFITKTGDYLICFRNPSPGEIAHEVTHMLHTLYTRHGYRLDQDNDEMFCYMLNYFVDKIYKKVTT